jgi:hypothetical protein
LFWDFAWKRPPEESKKPVPDWFHFPIQIVAAACLLYWRWHQPAPNKAVLALAAVAALMVLADMRPIHKAIYFVIIIALVFAENRAIDKDRADFARDEASRRQEENQKFSDIGTAITSNVRKLFEHSDMEFSKTMARSDAIMAGVSDDMKTQTGGNSFAYVTFTPQQDRFLVAITSHGKYPLREIHVMMTDQERSDQALQEYMKQHPGPIPPVGNDWIRAVQAGDTYYQVPYLRPQSPQGPTGDVQLLGQYPFETKDTKDITVAFSAPNGYWNERLHLRKVSGKWHQSLSVMGPTVRQALHPFIYFDPDYPEGKALAERDWQPVKRQSR